MVNRFMPNTCEVELQDGRKFGLPLWMLDESYCTLVRDVPGPQIELKALQSLRRLLDAQPLIAAVFQGIAGDSGLTGVTDGKEDRPATQAAVQKPAWDASATDAVTPAPGSTTRADALRAGPSTETTHEGAA